MRRTLLLCIAALVLAGCGRDAEDAQRVGSPTPSASPKATAATAPPTAAASPEIRTDHDLPSYEDLVHLFDYDASEPLSYEVVGSERERGATVYQVTYRSSGFEVPAYLVIPDGGGPFPAVLYAHGYTVGAEWFLPDAVAMAQAGYAGLLIEYPLGRRPIVSYYSCAARDDIKGYVQYVVDLRRGLDLLETLPEIDGGRLGLLGHSLGAEVAGILTGLEGGRVVAFVIMDGVGRVSEDTGNNECASLPDDELLRFRDQIAVLDAVNYIEHDRGAALLFQVSSSMMEGTGSTALMNFEVAPEPKALIEYPDYDHLFGCYDYTLCDPSLLPYVDHRAWLQENL